jgi:predicted RNA methylase
MRLVAQTKLGFYPAHPDAISLVLGHLRVPEGEVHILDPCCGEGKAIEQIREGLGIPSKNVYAVELDGGRALKARETLGPEAHLLGPCSYLEARINNNSFGMAWMNPPFDNELGGGKRQEHTFVQNVTKQLRGGGLLVLVMPTTAIQNNTDFQAYLDNWYDEAALYSWPEEHRRYREVVYIGYRREEPIPADSTAQRFLKSLGLRGEPRFQWSDRYSPASGAVSKYVSCAIACPIDSRPPASVVDSRCTRSAIFRMPTGP